VDDVRKTETETETEKNSNGFRVLSREGKTLLRVDVIIHKREVREEG
jgi:hypothetical protein